MGGKPTKFVLEGTSGLWDVPVCSASWSFPISGNPHIILSHSSWSKLTRLSSFLPHGSRSLGHRATIWGLPTGLMPLLEPLPPQPSIFLNVFFFFFLNDHTENICMESRVFLVTETVADPKFLPSRPLGTPGLPHLLTGAFIPRIHSL